MAIKKFLGIGKPAPLDDAVVYPTTGRLTEVWQRWFERVAPTHESIPNVINVTALEEQGAAILATDFSLAVLPEGLYRASYLARITRAGTVSSSLTITIAWTDQTVAKSLAGAAIVGNTTATYQSGSVLLRSDAGEDVTFAAAYATAGATSMQYGLDLVLERLKA